MKNKKGFVLSTYIYVLLVFFLLLLVVMLSVLNNTKLLSKKLQEKSESETALKSSSFSLVLLGNKDLVVEQDSTFTDPGVIATSKSGKDLTKKVITTSTVDMSTKGSYQISYRLTYNGITKEVVRNVKVSRDTKIYLDALGGTGIPKYIEVLAGDVYGDLPEPTKEGKTFAGWYMSQEYTTRITPDTEMDSEVDFTIYALWVESEYTFSYLASEQTFTAPADGYYNLEAWGAQGGTYNTYIGGYGGYSTGKVYLSKGETIYIYTGGMGGSNASTTNTGGYNGGGYSGNNSGAQSYGGGGATHIAKTTGLLSTLSSNLDSILIVASGGGGATSGSTTLAGSGGGYVGNPGTASNSTYNSATYLPGGGTQTSVGFAYETTSRQGAFGTGKTSNSSGWGGGGGGGLYGGSNGCGTTGAGGSGYIGNDALVEKYMYCYNCTESNGTSTKTISTTNVGEHIEKYANTGNGYVRITYILPEKIESTKVGDTFEFDFLAKTQKFVAPATGYYEIEAWGAQGGTRSTYIGGYGGYSTGKIFLKENETIYIYTGGMGGSNASTTNTGGYNGGGYSGNNGGAQSYGGGGATHISKANGLLSTLSDKIESIIIVAGGGGGATAGSTTMAGAGGGYVGNSGTSSNSTYNTSTYLPGGGSQTAAGTAYQTTRQGAFGTGKTANTDGWGGGGGGGLYGGGNGHGTTGAGGSGYIGNDALIEKYMYCYNCSESSDASTKTISTTCTSATATSNCSKQGNGYVKIKYEGYNSEDLENILKTSPFEFPYTGDVQEFEAPIAGYYKLEVWGAQGGTYSSTYYGGYGAYSTGAVYLEQNEKVYVYVGGQGSYAASTASQSGGYNGGGTGKYNGGGGGGATHISTTTGLLSTLGSNLDSILIVAGGGGGGGYTNSANGSAGGSGGGVYGVNATVGALSDTLGSNGYGTGGSQFSAGVSSKGTSYAGNFGLGGSSGQTNSSYGAGGGGGGYYGGGATTLAGGGGGSGYIGNSKLIDGIMYCYNCTASTGTKTKTISVTDMASHAANKANTGSGYAKITYLDAEKDTSFNIGDSEEFDSVEGVQEFIAPVSGTYKLEAWGAQGATYSSTYYGGYGGYSTGTIHLDKNEKIYIYVGKKGNYQSGDATQSGGYNGGGSGKYNGGGGGGATHISTTTGLLSTHSSDYTTTVLIAAGGGGGGGYTNSVNGSAGGSGGGFNGTGATVNALSDTLGGNGYGTGGTQTSAGASSKGTSYTGSFGLGGSSGQTTSGYGAGGGGGGLYGGGATTLAGGGGGSGYIGNSLLSNKSMYCYNCTESSDASTKTVSTTCTNATATSNCSKQGNGYAKITLISE